MPQTPNTPSGNSFLPSSLLAGWLDHLAAERGLSANTGAAYEQDIRLLADYMQERETPLDAVTELFLIDFTVWLKERGDSARSVARRLSSVRGFLGWCVEEEELAHNPAHLLDSPKLPHNLPDVLSRGEIEAILAVPDTSTKLGQRDKTMLELLYATGLRVTELVNLAMRHVDTQRGLLRVIGKGNKERFVPVHHAALSLLADYARTCRPLFGPQDEALFLNRSGKKLSRQAVFKLIQRYALEAMVYKSISPHTFRHSFATHLLEGGADLRSLQLMLGHADLSATELYTHVQASRLTSVHRAHHPRSRPEGQTAPASPKEPE